MTHQPSIKMKNLPERSRNSYYKVIQMIRFFFFWYNRLIQFDVPRWLCEQYDEPGY